MATDDEPFFEVTLNGKLVKSPRPSDLVRKVSNAFINSHLLTLLTPLKSIISVPFGQRINYAQKKYRNIIVGETASTVKMTVVGAFVEPLVEPYIRSHVLKSVVSGAITGAILEWRSGFSGFMSGACTGAAQNAALMAVSKLASTLYSDIRSVNNNSRNKIIFDHPINIMKQAYTSKYNNIMNYLRIPTKNQ